VYVVPAQLAAAQIVLFEYFSHALAPSHEPFVPHDAEPWSAHSLSGSLPAPYAMHDPWLPDWLHDWQVPLHAELQQ
jgi:hypothetical protein